MQAIEKEAEYREFRVEYVVRVRDGRTEERVIEDLRHDLVAGTRHDQHELKIAVLVRSLEVEAIVPVPSANPQHRELYSRYRKACQLGFDAEEIIEEDFQKKADGINHSGDEAQFDYLVQEWGDSWLLEKLAYFEAACTEEGRKTL